MTDKEYKELSVKEFSKAAKVYETDEAGVYKMCKKDYPDVLAELEKEDFTDLLDCGCGTAPMITLLQVMKKQGFRPDHSSLFYRNGECVVCER